MHTINSMDPYRPSQLTAADIAACVGLISDTHMPQRWPSLPPAVFTALNGVDMVLHAGDVGELWVLDELSQIAPVTAVHGNDETRAASAALPEKVLLTIAGQRLLLWHGHYTHRADEMANRQDDALAPKLARLAAHAHAVGATGLLFGHWHIPLAAKMDGVLLVNAGAVASGNFITRQSCQSVARIYLTTGGERFIVHIDLATAQAFTPQFHMADGFAANLQRVSKTIAEPLILANLPYLQEKLGPLMSQGLQRPLLQLLHRCWHGDEPQLTIQKVTAAVMADSSLLPAVRQAYQAIIAALPHQETTK